MVLAPQAFRLISDVRASIPRGGPGGLPRTLEAVGSMTMFGQGSAGDIPRSFRSLWVGRANTKFKTPPHSRGSSGSCAPCQTATTHTVASLTRYKKR